MKPKLASYKSDHHSFTGMLQSHASASMASNSSSNLIAVLSIFSPKQGELCIDAVRVMQGGLRECNHMTQVDQMAFWRKLSSKIR